MIRRVRTPQGDVRDVDMGPGPVGGMSMPGYARRIFGAPVAQSVESTMPKLGFGAARNRRNRERKR